MTASSVRHSLRVATDGDIAAVARLIGGSFASLDVSAWLVPHPQHRAVVLARYFTLLVEHAVEHGHVDLVEFPAGRRRVPIAAGVWLRVPSPDIPNYAPRMADACGPSTARFAQLEHQMHRAHPQDRGAHAYLALLAAGDRWQNQGLGTALLDRRLNALDRNGMPSYLEASNRRSRALYLRKGYVDCAPAFDLPYDGEPLYPMWRAVP